MATFPTFIPSPVLRPAKREGGCTGIGGIRKAGIADVLTVSNGICGLLAIYLFITQAPDITWGSVLILMGFVFDGADGWAARRFGTKHDFGRHLDSISDAITFCAAPAVMVAVVFTGTMDSAAFDAFVLLTAFLLVGLGWFRLYRFSTRGFVLPHFTGLATPAMAFLAIMVCHILYPGRWEEDVVSLLAVLIMFIAALLMVAPVRYPKVRGRTAVLLMVGLVVGLVVIGVMKEQDVPGTDDLYRAMAVFALALVSGYVLMGPVWMAARGEKVT